jgi:type IV secretory pathway TraG/TraD family ATPase VirD4
VRRYLRNGNNESIVSNCHVRVVFVPSEFETAKLISDMTGTTIVQKARAQSEIFNSPPCPILCGYAQ